MGRRSARALRPLPEPSWRTAKTPPSPALWLAMSVGVLEQSGAGKIPMSETMGIERLGRFPAGCQVQRGGGMGVKNYTSISCHSFLLSPPPLFPSFTPAACRGAYQAVRAGCPAGRGLDQGGRTSWISDDEGLDRIIGAGPRGLYDGVGSPCGPGNGSPHDNSGAILRTGVFCRIKPNIDGDAAEG